MLSSLLEFHIGQSLYKFHGDEHESEVWRQKLARSTCALKQLDLKQYGINIVDFFGLTFFSVKSSPKLFVTIEEALDVLGLCLVVTIDGHVFIETYG